MSAKRTTTCDEMPEQSMKKTKHERLTGLDDLPNEIILLICRYLKPIHVLQSFIDCNKRLFSCISEYHQKIDLTKCSCEDFSYYAMLFHTKRIHPDTVIMSNAQISRQIEIFFGKIIPSLTYNLDSIRHLLLFQYSMDQFYSINFHLAKFKSLQTLKIVQSTSDDDQFQMSYLILEELNYLIFYRPLIILTTLELITNDGLILNKPLPPNINLKYLTISLQNVNDLYVLLDGLVPNLIVLYVTLCQSDIDHRLSLPKLWPSQSMSRLREFQLVTKENVQFSFDQLCNIVIPLIQLNILTLYIREWVSEDELFVRGDQLQMLFEQFLPNLDQFSCSIRTIEHIDMQTFSTINKRWPMKCRLSSNSLHKHLYTIPWEFKQLDLSILDNDRCVSTNVRYLTVDVHPTSIYLSHRFPNIHSLVLLPQYRLAYDDYLGFHQLRHLTMRDINTVPSMIIQRIHTLTLVDVTELSRHLSIYPNLRSFILQNNSINSFATVQTIIRHFPNLHSLHIGLQHVRTTEYYHTLNMLLDGEHLPHLLLLKTNWIDDDDDEISDLKVSLWLSSKTSIKWRSKIFCAYRNENDMIISL